jgi:uncharacterized protein (DUF1697 family)
VASVVFLRGVNVGGMRVFRPSLLATQLARFGVVNIGAAGTVVVRGAVSQAVLRSEIARRLAFEPEIMICDARDVLALVAADPFRDCPGPPEVTRFVTVLSKRPRSVPALPIEGPPGDPWQMKIFDVRGRFVLSLWRRIGEKFLDPGRLVGDTSFGVTGTTRNWNTIVKVAAVLDSPLAKRS